MRCGAEYLYDWNAMQRAGRFKREENGPELPVVQKCNTWRPRARRVSVEQQVHFREAGSEQWLEGIIRNVSETGVLIVASELLAAGVELEMKFVMPKELSGQEGSVVLTSGVVARVLPESENGPGRMAATIEACRFFKC